MKLRSTLCALVLALSVSPPVDSTTLRTDQVRPMCESKREIKRWNRDYNALPDADKHWMDLWASKTKEVDYNRDGTMDTLEIVATQYIRECNIQAVLPYKEIQVTLTNGKTGRKILWNWEGGIPEGFTMNLDDRSITIRGYNYDQSRWEKVLNYD